MACPDSAGVAVPEVLTDSGADGAVGSSWP